MLAGQKILSPNVQKSGGHVPPYPLNSVPAWISAFHQGCIAGVIGGRRFLGGVGVGSFCPTPTPDVQLDHFLHHSPKSGIPVDMVQFLLKLLLKQRFLAVYHDFR